MDDKQLLLFDAEGPLRRALAEQLAALGYEVGATAAPSEAAALAGGPGLLIIIGAPKVDPATLCETWCNAGAAVLVLVEDGDMAAAAEAAGAATLMKPVRLADLARTVKELLRTNLAPDLEIGVLRFHPPTRELSAAGSQPVRLTEKEAAILAHLHQAGANTVPRERLLAQIWGYASEIATHTLETHIYRLRRKLALAAPEGPRLVSDDNGYRLVLSDAADQPSASTAR